MDLHPVVERGLHKLLHDAIRKVSVIEDDTRSLLVTLELDDDRVDVELDEAGRVVEVSNHPSDGRE